MLKDSILNNLSNLNINYSDYDLIWKDSLAEFFRTTDQVVISGKSQINYLESTQVASAFTTPEIALYLKMSTATVCSIIRDLKNKLQCRSDGLLLSIKKHVYLKILEQHHDANSFFRKII